MIERSPATEAEVIYAFLRAEADPASHWSGCVSSGLIAIHAERSLIDSPNLKDPVENRKRRELLHSYRHGQFAGFPADATWRTVDLRLEDFHTILYMDHPNWKELSNGTRLVLEGARNLPRFASDRRFQHIVGICHAISTGKLLPPLIAAQQDGGPLVLIEGHSRATAYVAAGFCGLVEAFVGTSSSMKTWRCY